MRVEQTQVSYTIPPENIYYPGSDAYDYFELFPNVKLTYSLSAANRLVAAYNRRVDRPGEPELRIFPKYDDPELLKVGNPFLRPQFTNAFELGFARSWTGGSVSDGALPSRHHRRVPRASSPSTIRIRTTTSSTGSTRTPATRSRPACRCSSRSDVASRGGCPATSTGSRTTSTRSRRRCSSRRGGRSRSPRRRDDTWDLTFNNQIQLPRAGELQASYIYYAARNVPQGRERARSSVDLAAKWPIMNERAELLFTFTDIFNDFAVQREIDGEGFTALYQNFLETQVATLGLRFRF